MEKTQVAEFAGLTVTLYVDATSARYHFVGDIAENITLKEFPRIDRTEITFDLAGITSVNSCGVRTWIQLIREITQKAHLRLENCTVSIVDQFNLIPQTLGAAEVTSFFAPYYCATCDEEVTHLIETADHWATLSTGAAPAIKHHCGTNLEFDALEDVYFNQIDKFTKLKAG